MKTRSFPVPTPDWSPAARQRVWTGQAQGADAGFTLLEILLAVGLLALIAVTALHSRVVLIRAERQARHLDAARLLLRQAVSADRAGQPVEEIHGDIPDGWQLEVSEAQTVAAAARVPLAWRIWRLTSDDGRVVLEVATDVLTAGFDRVSE